MEYNDFPNFSEDELNNLNTAYAESVGGLEIYNKIQSASVSTKNEKVVSTLSNLQQGEMVNNLKNLLTKSLLTLDYLNNNYAKQQNVKTLAKNCISKTSEHLEELKKTANSLCFYRETCPYPCYGNMRDCCQNFVCNEMEIIRILIILICDCGKRGCNNYNCCPNNCFCGLDNCNLRNICLDRFNILSQFLKL